MSSPAPSGVRAWAARTRTRYSGFTVPRADGLPRYRVLLSFPALLLILGAILVGLGINGSSSGAMFHRVESGRDPQLIAGSPELIRSDEWYVGASWYIAQVQQGLPERNETVPGGMDAALPFDLPRADWSVAFRPHLWGYLVLDVNNAMAWKWWAPALALMAAAFVFLVTVLPRRPILAATISIGFFASPFFQWWFQPAVFWPVVWALVAMTALLWSVKNRSTASRWIWASVVGYLTVVMAMGIYAPYIIPVVFVVALFAVGLIVARLRAGSTVLSLLWQAVPILVMGAVGAVITELWLRSKSATVDAFLSTTYPGERLTPTGASTALSLARTVSSSFSEALKRGAGFLGTNSSEASTFFFIGIFLIPIVGWIVYRSVRQKSPLPWVLLGLVASVLLFLAFAYVPGWNAVAHLLFLDRTTDGRTRIGLGLASIAILAYVIRYLDEHEVRAPKSISIVTAVLFLLSQVGIAGAFIVVEGAAKLFQVAPLWWLFASVSAAAILLIARRRIALGALAFVLVTVLSTITVNPIYRGIFDLRTTAASKEIVRIDRAHPGTWVGLGDIETGALVLESGVRAFNGVQGAPSRTMWKEIDPAGKYIGLWNRLAGLGWEPGVGEPVVQNPAPDQILISFDACSVFAQKHVNYLLTDHSDLNTTCLVEDKSYALPTGKELTIYRVVAPH